MYDEIVFPTDGGNASKRACEDAIELAEAHDATLHVLYVVDEATLEVLEAAGGELEDEEEIAEGMTKEGEETVKEVAERASESDVPVKTTVRRGEPKEEINAYVDKVDGDIVVMGTEERPSEYRELLGSVTEKVLRTSSTPTLVVKTPEQV